MAAFARSPVTAVLGPTNTGKTHLAVERMCGHSSGMIGFPLRLLAREVYDRVVRLKGERQVALLTGEEKILPRDARYFCCTAESMPMRAGRQAGSANEGVGDYAFVALDEAQLGADPERGHIFTDRLLHARGREETMILGSAALTPLVRSLVPEAEIIARPRFSTLTYAGAKKLSRLPPRSAIVAFSAEEVYAVAEMLRRLRGGAAVVLGALSPRTRNAQVAMFQAGEVDYLVATDAIGMGLNMDVAHVAFAGLSKFDGHRVRRLTVAEMAQIAGRAGRHQRDGTFGVLGTGADGDAAFTAEEIERIEEHRFQRMRQLYWREGDPDMSSVDALIGSLEAKPDRPELIAAPEAVDLAVLKRLAGDPELMARATGESQISRLWAACGLPDFQKLGADHHARLVTRVWRFLSEGEGHIPQGWFADQIARLDRVDGDIDTLSARIAAARSWSYIAHRADWLKAPEEMAERTRALEDRLSDALHGALTQRFVDRRTAVLLRDVGRRAADLLVDVDPEGAVSVDGAHLGRLEGFRFHVDPDARAGDRKLLLAAAERRLGRLLADKAALLIAAPDTALTLAVDAKGGPALAWGVNVVARLLPGAVLLAPEVRLDKALGVLSAEQQKQISQRLGAWVEAGIARHLRALKRIADGSRDAALPVSLRALLAQLAEVGGIADRASIDPALASLDKAARQALRREGVVIGTLDLFHPGLLKPGAMRWRLALRAARTGTPMAEPPPAGAVLLAHAPEGAGFRRLGEQWLRIDIAERLVRAAHERLDAGQPVGADDPMIISLGLGAEAFAGLMRAAGFQVLGSGAEGTPNWTFRGRRGARRSSKPATTPRATKPGAFSDLASMLGLERHA